MAKSTSTSRPWIMQYEFPSYEDAQAFREMLQEYGYEELAARALLRQRYDYFKPEEFAKWPITLAMKQTLSSRSFDKETLAIAMQEHGWGGGKAGTNSWLKRAIQVGIVARLEHGIYEFTRHPTGDTSCAQCKPEPLSCPAP